MATIQDALTNVQCLEALALPDEQPTIEPEPASVVYEISFDTNFADRTAFITGIGKYNEEATICSGLVGRRQNLPTTYSTHAASRFVCGMRGAVIVKELLARACKLLLVPAGSSNVVIVCT